MDPNIDLTLIQLASAYIFVVILLFIVRHRGINREREILLASVRMTLQLGLIGYVLVYIFDNPSPFYTIIFIILMEAFAIINIFKRVKEEISPSLKKVIALSMIVGNLVTMIYFLFIVIRVSPWYNPRYFIPITGMLIGNSMTGISLGVSRLAGGIESSKNQIEAALMLGATPKTAVKGIVDSAFDSAILPTINSMLGMGIVFLPGMMTGQILAGLSPISAIKYQIAIMLGILGSVSLTLIIFVNMAYKSFFNKESQLEVQE
nr:iron export ABC transporter permease subunit FetB [Tissierella sp.]